MIRTGALRLVGCLLALSLVLPPLGHADDHEDQQPRVWDQEKLTQLTADLAEAMSAVRTSARNEPSVIQRQQMNDRTVAQYLESLRMLERSTGQLSRRIRDGKGRDETMNLARRIGTLLRDAQVSGRRLDIPKMTMERIDVAMALIDEIEPYFRQPGDG